MVRLKELFELARVRSSLRDGPLREAEAEAQRLSELLDLDSRRRGENLRMLRMYMEATQESFREMLRISSQSEYSKIERGESLLTDSQAKLMELELGVAPGWLDRNNCECMFLTNDEMLLIRELRKHKPSSVEATVALIRTFDGG